MARPHLAVPKSLLINSFAQLRWTPETLLILLPKWQIKFVPIPTLLLLSVEKQCRREPF